MTDKRPIVLYTDSGNTEEIRNKDALLLDLIKLNKDLSGVTASDGMFEYKNNHLYFTINSISYQLDQQSSSSSGVTASYVTAMAIALG